MDMPAWSDYQEEVAEFFRSLGLNAETNVELQGARTTHAIDVVVRSTHVGFDTVWLVECKAWNRAVSKEKVLALRAIVNETGADRGFMMAESGYQSGALESARLSNITLTSIADLRETLAYDIGLMALATLHVRVQRCTERYWALGKYDRIDHGLRPDVFTWGYSGARLMSAIEQTLSRVRTHGFPIAYNESHAASAAFTRWVDPPEGDGTVFDSPTALYDFFDEALTDLEQRLTAAEVAVSQGDPSTDAESEI